MYFGFRLFLLLAYCKISEQIGIGLKPQPKDFLRLWVDVETQMKRAKKKKQILRQSLRMTTIRNRTVEKKKPDEELLPHLLLHVAC